MKKTLLIAGLVCVTIIPPAAAVTKCVALNSNTTCDTNSTPTGQSNWSISCGDIPIQGVAFCGSQNGGTIGKKSTTVTTSSTSDENKYCWCKMISPAVSSWVFYNNHASTDGCANACARGCGNAAQVYASFRSALFSDFSD